MAEDNSTRAFDSNLDTTGFADVVVAEPNSPAIATRPLPPQFEPEIVVQEATYAWPVGLGFAAHGDISISPNWLFRKALAWVERQTEKLIWVPFFRNARDGLNAISQHPHLVASLERMFKDQLEANYTDVQRHLLDDADLVLISFDEEKGSIVSYGSSNLSKIGSIEGVSYQVSHGGHMIVAPGNERRRLAPYTALALALHGHRITDLFRREILLLRTNNKYIERLMRRMEPVFRSDQISLEDADSEVVEIAKAMAWTDENLFCASTPLEFGKPIPINHRFAPEVTIDGVGADEIIYLARISSLGRFLYALAK